MNNELILKKFEGQEVAFKEVDGVSMVRINEVGKFCGWTQNKNGKEYVKFERIQGYLNELNYSPQVGKGDFIPEYIMYPLIGKAKNEKATQFMLWVGQVLVDIRKYGAFISKNEDEVDQEYIKYAYGQIRETFNKCHIEELREEYEQCINWYKTEKYRLPYANNSKRRKGSKHTETETRELVMGKITHCLEGRSLELKESGKFGLASEVDSVIKSIKDDVKKLNNKVNGGIIASKTKENKKLKNELNYHNPELEEYTCVKYHPFSANSMYDKIDGKYIKSNNYKTWISKFPKHIIYESFKNIDLSKPTKMWLKFDCMDRFDADNLVKSIQDQIVRDLEAENDNNIIEVKYEINKRVKAYSEGKIYILLKNI